MTHRRPTLLPRAALVAALALVTSSVGLAAQAHSHPTSVDAQVRVAAPAVEVASGEATDATHLVFLRGGHGDTTSRSTTLSAPAIASVTASAAQRARTMGASVISEYAAVGGYAAQLNSAQADALRNDPAVESVVPNGRILAPRLRQETPALPTGPGSQTSATWGIDRIDQRALPLDQSYAWNSAGKDVTVYVMDSGIRPTHREVQGKLAPGYTVIKDRYGTGDCYGHGTFMAGVIAGRTHGVARDATLIPVRFFDCNAGGTDAGFVDALNWILERGKPGELMNASWGERVRGPGIYDKSDKIVEAIVAKGVTVVAGAGNDYVDACTFAPARVPSVLTVAGSSSTDAFAKRYSNYGKCVDIVAPGQAITSAWWNRDDAVRKASGTSAAAPFVVGALARYLSTKPGAMPAELTQWVLGQATSGALTGVPQDTPNAVLYADPAL